MRWKNLKNILILIVCIFFFVGCNSNKTVTKELDDEEDIFAVMEALEVLPGNILLRNTEKYKDMATWTQSKPLETYLKDGSISIESGFYIPTYLPDKFKFYSDFTISSLYITKDSIDLSEEPIESKFDDRYIIYNAKTDYDEKIQNFIYFASPEEEELMYQSVSFDYQIHEFDNSYDLASLIEKEIIVNENEILDDYSISEIELDLFEKAFYLEATENSVDKNKFIRVYGINPIDNIEYYNFYGNTTEITVDNLDDYKKFYNHEVFTLGYTEFKDGAEVTGVIPTKEEMIKIANNLEFYKD